MHPTLMLEPTGLTGCGTMTWGFTGSASVRSPSLFKSTASAPAPSSSPRRSSPHQPTPAIPIEGKASCFSPAAAREVQRRRAPRRAFEEDFRARWGFPADLADEMASFVARQGTHKYYIFSKGTYKVGRKDCHVIIQTDRAVSRVHAEIIVDVMAPQSSSRNGSSNDLPNVRIRDLSKFGTFINKDTGNQAINTFPNKEAVLKDGDLISFGTGIATFRFCFVPIVAFVDSSKLLGANHSLDVTILSLGAQATHCWGSECTHMIVDESTPVTAGLIGAVMAQKPVVRATWFMSLAEKNIRTEMPSCALHVPSLMLDGMSVKVVEPTARESSLNGYTFVLGQSHLYKLGSKLPSLIQLVGGRILHVDDFSSSS